MSTPIIPSHFAILILLSTFALAAEESAKPPDYPVAKKGNVVEELHNVRVAAPYRWMEDMDSPRLKEWIDQENELTFGWLDDIPAREPIRRRLTDLWNYERYSPPLKKGDHYFFARNDGLQNQSVYYVLDELDGQPRVLLDPNTLSEEGTTAVRDFSVSDDARYLAYGLSVAGSDWVEYHVRDIATGRDLPDHLQWVKFSDASWSPDSNGFYYSRYDKPEDPDKLQTVNRYQKLYFHKLGTPQDEDRLIYECPDQPDWGIDGQPTRDGKYLIIYVWQGTERKNRLYYIDLRDTQSKVIKLLDDCDAQYWFIDNDGPRFWLFTDLDAPKGRVIAVDIDKPARKNWIEVIPETEHSLENINIINKQFVAHYLADARSKVMRYRLDGTPIGPIELPGLGTVDGFEGEFDDTETFFLYTDLRTPATIYRCDMTDGKCSLFRRPVLKFDPEQYVTRQVFYAGKDGTRVPMFIAHKKGLELDGTNPTYLYAYGGFKISNPPFFYPGNILFMEMSGIFALANIRGGGEYGSAWHEAGRLKNKQNSFDDFLSAAQWLIDEGYTSPEKLAIAGGSNGGLLVGACVTQQPDLFAAALPVVGVFDMLRFHKFTIGWAWTAEYGNPEDPEMFQVLYAYSPLHNVKPGTCYPAMLIRTADHDDRVVPSHSFKFTAALQAAQSCANPILLRVQTQAGHGRGTPTTMRINEETDKYAFLTRILDMDWEKLKSSEDKTEHDK